MAKVKVPNNKLSVLSPQGRSLVVDALAAVRKLTLPVKTFYWLNKITPVVEKEIAEYETARVELVMKMGEKMELPGGGTSYQVSKEKDPEFQKELATLVHEVELPIDDACKLVLPTAGIADDWYLLMSLLDIFEEPK